MTPSRFLRGGEPSTGALAAAAMIAAPFAAVLIGLYALQSAWAAILLYHAQIVFWAVRIPRDSRALRKGWSPGWFLALAIPCALTVPAVLVFLDDALRTDLLLGDWLARHGLSGGSFLAFAAYYGLVHPLLEEHHWDLLRERSGGAGAAHVAFAAYHGLVLFLILDPAWALAVCLLLLGASKAWSIARRRLGGLLVPLLSHALADAALIVTTYLIVER